MTYANRELKTLICDLEISYAIYYAFPSKKPQFLHSSQLKEYFFCPCAAWRWDHEATTQAISVLNNKTRYRKSHKDDYIIAKKLHDLFNEADIIVAHNGDAFDIKHANLMFAKHGLAPVKETKSVDTLKIARQRFSFAGNDLDHLCKFFKIPGKTEKPDWIRLTEGYEDEIQKATEYCKNDVDSLYGVFKQIAPFIKKYPAMRKAMGGVSECDFCKSKHLQKRGFGFDGNVYARIKCMSCGKEHKERVKN
jgi:hypothetical protein